MANHVYTQWVHYTGMGAFNWRESATTSPTGVASQSNVKVMLVMTNSTAGPAGTNNGGTLAENILAVGSFTTLDEFDGSGYTGAFAGAGRIALANQTATFSAAGKRTQLDADDISWTSLGAGTRQVKGLLVFFQPNGAATDADNIPVAWIDSISGGQSFPFATSGGNVSVAWASIGVLIGGDKNLMSIV